MKSWSMSRSTPDGREPAHDVPGLVRRAQDPARPAGGEPRLGLVVGVAERGHQVPLRGAASSASSRPMSTPAITDRVSVAGSRPIARQRLVERRELRGRARPGWSTRG